MSSVAKFTENETGIVVDVETVFRWEPHALTCVITYPSGRKYALPESELNKHFSIVTPQEVFMRAFGGVDDRPTPKQREAG
jgi:hypothetical protein